MPHVQIESESAQEQSRSHRPDRRPHPLRRRIGSAPRHAVALGHDSSRSSELSSGGSSVHRAVSELNSVILALQKTLRELEDALHLLETAEEQKSFDEKELVSLRRAMGQLKRTREPAELQARQTA